MKITIDEDRCIGGGQCVLSAPDLFDQNDEDGTALLLRNPTDEDVADAQQAARVCPADAIEITDS